MWPHTRRLVISFYRYKMIYIGWSGRPQRTKWFTAVGRARMCTLATYCLHPFSSVQWPADPRYRDLYIYLGRLSHLKVPQILCVMRAPVLLMTATISETMVNEIADIMHLSMIANLWKCSRLLTLRAPANIFLLWRNVNEYAVEEVLAMQSVYYYFCFVVADVFLLSLEYWAYRFETGKPVLSRGLGLWGSRGLI